MHLIQIEDSVKLAPGMLNADVFCQINNKVIKSLKLNQQFVKRY